MLEQFLVVLEAIPGAWEGVIIGHPVVSRSPGKAFIHCGTVASEP